MNTIKLNERLSLSIEKEEKRLRLVVSDGTEELVCHKVNPSELKKFVQTTEGHLFKGRLQLNKKDGHIFINVKGEVASSIILPDFENLINQSYQPEQIT